jgi:predicted nuclease of predicted toxin-antitoxin system
MKLYLDEHLPPIFARMLRERGIDCLTTQEAGNMGFSDDAQLTYAASHGRVLITFDRKDFLSLAKQWAELDQPHAGIVLSKQCPASDLLRQILHLIAQRGKDDLSNHILWLQNYKDAPLP